MTTDLHHLAAAYVLDALEADEQADFEQHLDTCATCRDDVRDFAATASILADASLTSPPAGLKALVMREISHTRQEDPIIADTAVAGTAVVTSLDSRRRRPSLPIALLASAAALAVLAVGAVALVGTRGGTGVDQLIAAPDASVTTLAAQTPGTPGTIQVVWSPSRDQVALIGNGLAEPDDGFIYELWAIAGDTSVPAGLFDPDDGSVRTVHSIGDVDAAAWGITIEPSAGSTTPTGDILYLAEV